MFENVKQKFQRRFSDFRLLQSEFVLFSDLFHCGSGSAYTNMQLELIELQERSDSKSFLVNLPLDMFYFSGPASTYPAMRKHAFRLAFFWKYSHL